MTKEPKIVRIELTNAEQQEPRQQPERDAEAQELEIAELEPRITPTSIDTTIGTFF